MTLDRTIEQTRRRLWAICYRMTGRSTDADDLCQEAIARALERREQLASEDPTGWLVRIATTTCLDHLRRETVRRRATELVDFVDLPGLAPGELVADPERAAILRDDIRYAFVVALQHVAPRQRAALVMHDVCDRPLDEVAAVLEINVNATKALLHRARTTLSEMRNHSVDIPVDRDLVESLARAIESGSLDTLATLISEDAWGVVDGGGVIPVPAEPSVGRDAVVRRFVNGWRRVDHLPLAAAICVRNAEPLVVVRVRDAAAVFAAIHIETHAGCIVSLRVDRDPRRLAAFAPS